MTTTKTIITQFITYPCEVLPQYMTNFSSQTEVINDNVKTCNMY